jgi:hypothetical protein
MTTPTGSPAWTGTADATVYGGHPDKRDYQAQGVVNPQTDISAAEFQRLCADLAAIVRVSPFAVLHIECDDTTPGPPTVTSVRQQTGVAATAYLGDDAPAGFPAVTRNGDGDITITWDASYSDDFGQVAPIVVSMAKASIANDDDPGEAVCDLVSDTAVRVRAFIPAGTAFSDAEVVVEVWV